MKTTEQKITYARDRINEKFSNITFKEDTHQYFIKDLESGNQVEYTPVSYVIEKWIPKFDSEEISRKYAKKHNLKQEDVLDMWDYENKLATVTGTLVHEFGESYGWLKGGFPEKITETCKRQYISEKKWLIPTRHKEKAVRQFWETLDPSLHFVSAECQLCSQYLNKDMKMSGTFDLLLYYDGKGREEKSGFVLCDYKTNKELIKNTKSDFMNKTMKFPFDGYVDDALYHYFLQFACYQLMLESIDIPIIGRRLIWLKDDESFSSINIPDISKKVYKAILGEYDTKNDQQ